MNEQTSPSVDADPDLAAVDYGDEYWRGRALEAERRLEEHRALADEQAEIRRRGTEMLEDSRAALERECAEWRARALVAEAKVADYLASLDEKYVDLDSELDGWRRRAIAAEALVREQQLELEAKHDAREPQPRENESVLAPNKTPTVAPGPRPERPAPRRPRGNWLA